MNTLRLVPALALFIAGCELIEEKVEDTDTTTDTGDDTGDDTGAPQVAQVRFINVNPDIEATIQVDIGGDGVDAESTLYFTQGTGWFEVPAGVGTVTVLSGDDEVVKVVDVPFGAGQSYSIAPTNQPGAWIKTYLPDGIAADHTRVNLRNAYQGAELEAWIGYLNNGGYAVEHVHTLGANGEYIEDLPYHNASVQLEHLYDDQDQLIVDWEFSSIVQVGNNSVVDVYTLLDGDCSYLSSTCEPWLIAHYADGTTATVDVSHGWVPKTDADGDGFYDYEDCDDDNAATYPGADEICDGLDNDCDGNLGTDVLYELASDPVNAIGINSTDQSPGTVGVVVTPDVDLVLDSVEVYYDMDSNSASTEVKVVLYEQTGTNAYTRVASESITVLDPADWYGVSGLSWSLEAGKTYLVGITTKASGSIDYVVGAEAPPWGTFEGMVAEFSDFDAATLNLEVAFPSDSIAFRFNSDC